MFQPLLDAYIESAPIKKKLHISSPPPPPPTPLADAWGEKKGQGRWVKQTSQKAQAAHLASLA